MLYLIEYERAVGIVSLKGSTDAERSVAEDARLHLELQLNRSGVQREVVLLEAAS